MEIFKEISDYSNYEVSNLGNVRSRKMGRTLRYSRNNGGYKMVILCKDGKKKMFYIHRLVASVFLPNPENKRTVNHINGNKSDNRADNLEWNSYSENLNHAIRTGLRTKTRLLKQKVRCIETNQEFESQLSASKYFGCYQGSIRQSIYKGYTVLKKYHFELIE